MRAVRLTLWVMLALAALVAGALIGLGAWVRQKQAFADRTWAESFEPMGAFRARYPTEPDNEAARELARRSEALGIPLLAPTALDQPIPKALLDSLVRFVSSQALKADDENTDALPLEAAAFLQSRSSDIDRVEAALLRNGPIKWRVELLEGAFVPPPFLVGQRQLQAVLLARTLDAARRGDGPAVERALDACWALSMGIRERPEIISQLISLTLSLMRDGVLRRVAAVPARWMDRLSSHDWRAETARSLQAEALGLTSGLEQTIAARDGAADEPRARRFLPSVVLRLWMADASETMSRLAIELRQENPCTVDQAALSRRFEQAVPFWSRPAKMAIPGLANAWEAAGRAAVDEELTRLVLQAKSQVRGQGVGASLATSVPSAVCGGLTWSITTRPDGDIQIAADGGIRQRETPKQVLTFRVRFSAKR